MKERTWKLLLAASISVVVAGLVVHAIAPTQMSNRIVNFSDEDTFHEPLQMDQFQGIEYTLHIDMWMLIYPRENMSFAVVSETEYQRYTTGTPFNLLAAVVSESNFTVKYDEDEHYFNAILTCTWNAQGSFHLIIVNDDAYLATGNVFLSIYPNTYDIGLAIISWGAAVTAGLLVIFFKGWKRYLCIGTGINLAMFLARALLLKTFIELPAALYTVMHVEIYMDFQYQTFIWTDVFSRGIGLYSSAMPFTYPFPPLYVETCWLFNLLPLPAWKLAIPIFTFHILTGFLVYKIVLKLTGNERRANFSMILYFFNPFTLVYTSFAWLTPSPFVFFVMLTFYLAMEGKGEWSMVALSIAIMFKQYALIMVPFLVIALAKTTGARPKRKMVLDVIKHLAICGGIISLLSQPYLITEPITYLNKVFFSNAGGSSAIPLLATLHDTLSYPVNFNSFFLLIGMPAPITDVMATILAYNIPLVACGVLVYMKTIKVKVTALQGESKEHAKARLFAETMFWAMVLVFCLNIFYSRGVFKYYFVYLAPFLSIFFEPEDIDLHQAIDGQDVKDSWKIVTFTALAWVVVFFFRYAYLLIVLAWLVYILLKKRKQGPGSKHPLADLDRLEEKAIEDKANEIENLKK